jgi:ABC-type multidrug transport system fused ATPase/permease subunit
MLASSYPLLDIFVSIIEFFLLFLWIFLLVNVIFDIFRSHDLKGWHKALWLLFIIVLPLLGVLIYLIARGGSMHERSVQQARRRDEAFRDYVRQTAGDGRTNVEELERLSQLHDRGVLSDEEFQREKAKLLS